MDGLIAGPRDGKFRFAVPELMHSALRAFPWSESLEVKGRTAFVVTSYLYIKDPHGEIRVEAAFHRSGVAVGINGSREHDVANFVAWLCKAAAIPDTGAFMLIGFADGLVPLTQATTVEALMARL